MIKAVIFDMDGVLIDAKDWHYEALNRALALVGYEIPRDKHLTQYDGLPTSKKLDMLSLEEGLPRELHELINEKKQTYTMDLIHEKCKPNSLHENALFTLKSKGYKLALASNSIRNTVDIMMRKSNLDIYLDEMLSASEVFHPKPHPEIYNKTISKLGVLPKECLILEDNINGIKAAEASGAHVLVIHDINEVNIEHIMTRINKIDSEEVSHEACEA